MTTDKAASKQRKNGKDDKMKKALGIILIIALLTAVLVSCSENTGTGTQDNSAVTYISLSKKSITLDNVGATSNITCTVGPSTAKDKSVTWLSTDEAVAVVSQDGKIEAVGFGSCLIKAVAANGVSDSCVLIVENPDQSIRLDITDMLFESIGADIKVHAYDSFGNDITNDILWATSNRSVATCYYGKITTTGYGICTIKAITKNGESASCMIRVEDPNAPSLVINTSLIMLDAPDSEAPLEAISNNENAQIQYKSTNPDVAIYKNGKVVAVGDGECAIIATASNGASAAVAVRVGEHKLETPPSDRMTLSAPDIPLTVNYVDVYSGEIASSVLITSYDAHYENVDGNTRVKITLNCIKIYDRMGENGKTSCYIASDFYIDGSDKPLSEISKLQEAERYKVGESFTVSLAIFDVKTVSGIVRDITLLIPDTIEK